jgi:hypothetical protein
MKPEDLLQKQPEYVNLLGYYNGIERQQKIAEDIMPPTMDIEGARDIKKNLYQGVGDEQLPVYDREKNNNYKMNIRNYYNRLYQDIGGVEGLQKLREKEPDYVQQYSMAAKGYDNMLTKDLKENDNQFYNPFIPTNAKTINSIPEDYTVNVHHGDNLPTGVEGSTHPINKFLFWDLGSNIDLAGRRGYNVQESPHDTFVKNHELQHAAAGFMPYTSTQHEVGYLSSPWELEADIHAARAEYGKPIISAKDAEDMDKWMEKKHPEIWYRTAVRGVSTKQRQAMYRTIVSNPVKSQDNIG